ncbi:MAG TPA: ring-cleaving dioxygenase, partial [Bryobacteraceae bacterium]|nr:ring-cleaving dioxygenase [Bryobacteraceae bacterium]
SYHLYYGDAEGRPGTILTFFTWPGARQGRDGNGQLTATAFAIPKGSAGYWRERLAANGVAAEQPGERFGERVLPFSDPDGLRLELIETAHTDPANAWTASEVPGDAAISGFHGGTLSEKAHEPTVALLTDTMGLQLVGSEGNRLRYETNGTGAGRTIDIVSAPQNQHGRVAVGTVHHIAWRTETDEQQREWLEALNRQGYSVSPVMDRVYFHSIYYREPGGVLFEIATDQPGFAVDEPIDQLGKSLKLPSWFESHRAEIEASLPEISVLRKAAVK